MKNMLMKVAMFAALTFLCFVNPCYGQNSEPADTIVIKFGNESKILIYLNNKSDLDALLDYDINRMLKDLNIEIQEADGDISYLKIEDSSGHQYLADTTIVIEGTSRVAENAEEVDLDAVDQQNKPKDENDSTKQDSFVIKIPRLNTGERSKNKHRFNIELGLNNYFEQGALGAISSEDYAVKPFGSWYVGITSKRKSKIKGPLFLEWGGGVSWYNFKMENPDIRILNGEDGVVFIQEPVEINGIKSKLTASFINLSIIPVLDFSLGKRREALNISEGPFEITKYNKQGFRVGFGPYFGYRLGSHSKFKFEAENNVKKDKDSGSFYLNNLRYGLRLQMGYKGLDLFANYDLNTLFKEGHGPELNAFSFGIII